MRGHLRKTGTKNNREPSALTSAKEQGEVRLPIRFAMRNYAVVLVFLMHECFLASPFFTREASASEAVYESWYFALAVPVYAVSLFELGRLRYLLLPLYAYSMYRCAISLPSAWTDGDHLFFAGCLLALMALAGICCHIVFRSGVRMPQGWRMRLFLLCWLIALALVSRVPMLLIYSVGLEPVAVLYAFVFSAAFVGMALGKRLGKRLVAAQSVAILIFIVPFLRLFPLGPSSVFPFWYVQGSLVAILGAAAGLLVLIGSGAPGGRGGGVDG